MRILRGLLPSLLFAPALVQASVMGPPSCTVDAVVRGTTEKNQAKFLELAVETATPVMLQGKPGSCPKAGYLYLVHRPPGGLAKGQKLRAQVGFGGANGPGGPVTWIHWSPLFDSEGKTLFGEDQRPILSLAGPTHSAGKDPGEGPATVPRSVFAEGLIFDLPKGWTSRRPASPMRKAEVVVEGQGGDAVLTVFHFGVGGGGGVDANLGRWEGQIQGKTPARRDRLEGKKGPIHLVEKEGTQAPSRMGFGPKSPLPGQALIGAVVTGEGGPWFFKLLGPEATVRAQEKAFRELLREAR